MTVSIDDILADLEAAVEESIGKTEGLEARLARRPRHKDAARWRSELREARRVTQEYSKAVALALRRRRDLAKAADGSPLQSE